MPTVKTARAEIHYKDYRKDDSDLPPVVLVHGAGSQHLDWAIETRRGLNALAIDLPGHGKSPTPGRDSISAYAANVKAFAEALELDAFVLAGHSMGGAIGQQFALDYPDRLRGLVLIATGARLMVNDAILNGITETPQATADLIMKWAWSKTADPTFKTQGALRLLETPTDIILGDYAACNGFDVRERLHEISTPTLVISGTHDKMTPLTWNRVIAEGIPNSKIEVIENQSHMLHLECPEQVTQMIETWLRDTLLS
ncbi:MAG: alpha/beta hydrolase [Chloroflexota bacterium]